MVSFDCMLEVVTGAHKRSGDGELRLSVLSLAQRREGSFSFLSSV